MPRLCKLSSSLPARVSGMVLWLSAVAAPAAAPAAAQMAPAPKLVVTPRWPAEQFLSSQSSLEFTLDRPLDQPGERLALTIGTLDVSGLLEVRGDRARYRPAGSRLPSGASEVTAYLVTGGRWLELDRFPLKVRNRLGLDHGRVQPSVDLSSAGQLDRGGTDAVPGERRTHQDITLRIGLESEMARGKWRLATSGNAVGVSRETERLRWGVLEESAPPVDLSDYRIQVSRGGARLALGNLATGNHRYLINGFASRGASAQARLGSLATVEAALVSGTNVVGWSNLLGLGQPAHRISSAALSFELLPSRPGGVQVSLSGMDGSVLPLSDFNQGAATDAEESRGLGAQVALSDARQRIRFAAGVARSRFFNPNDPLLSGDTALVAVRPTSRTARYGELSLQLVQGLTLAPSIATALGATLRHERVDPLYRSLGASPAADVESNGLDLNASVGALALQASLARTRDNLAGLRSVLTSRTRSASAGAALPLGALVRRSDKWYYPQLTYAWQRSRQFGEGIPENGDFSASHVPDQVSLNQTGSLAWTRRSTSFTYQWNQSFQDNRQPGRERSDFRATVHGFSIVAAPDPRLSATVDAGIERQTSIEAGASQRLERVGSSLRWQATRTTELSGNLSQSWAFDPTSTARRRNTEFQLEISQGLNLYRRPEDGTQCRLFLRFGRSRTASYPLGVTDLMTRAVQWNLNAGGSLRLY